VPRSPTLVFGKHLLRLPVVISRFSHRDGHEEASWKIIVQDGVITTIGHLHPSMRNDAIVPQPGKLAAGMLRIGEALGRRPVPQLSRAAGSHSLIGVGLLPKLHFSQDQDRPRKIQLMVSVLTPNRGAISLCFIVPSNDRIVRT
jgi:hypothetical protein